MFNEESAEIECYQKIQRKRYIFHVYKNIYLREKNKQVKQEKKMLRTVKWIKSKMKKQKKANKET